jgi:protein-S-isoprenylcysteine O-methyltransferase Ste14
MSGIKNQQNIIYKWLKSTFNRIFIFYTIVIILVELLIQGGNLVLVAWGIPLMLWGYLQFRLTGKYRNRNGGGGPGLDIPPEKLVQTGIYAYTRNPMYLSYLIFLAGLAITFWSLPATILLIYHLYWFQQRVRKDEHHLSEIFGDAYLDYMARVKRWIPGIV